MPEAVNLPMRPEVTLKNRSFIMERENTAETCKAKPERDTLSQVLEQRLAQIQKQVTSMQSSYTIKGFSM